MTCPACHRAVAGEAKRCPHCGTTLSIAGTDAKRQGSALLGPQSHAWESGREEPALVDQEHALRRLKAAWRGARAGRGQFVSLVGEVGSGRSRLIRELGRAIDDEAPDARWLVGQANSYATYVPYHLLAGLLAPWVPDGGSASAAVRAALALETMAAGPTGDGATDPATVRGLARQLRDPRAAGRIDPAELAAALAAPLRPGDGPLIVVLEDLEWVDAPSRAVLDALLPALLVGPTLVLCTHHADWSHEWSDVSRHYHVILGPLGQAESRRLVETAAAWAGAGALPEETIEALVRAGAGSPLYLEQATLALCERWSDQADHADHAAGTPPAIPATLQEAILARIAALPRPARDVLVAAATIGQRFGYAAVAAVTGEHPGLDAGLGELLRRRWVERWREGHDILYCFIHVHLQEVAYGSLEPAERRTLEARVADWLLRAAAVESAGTPGTLEELATLPTTASPTPPPEPAGQVGAVSTAPDRDAAAEHEVEQLELTVRRPGDTLDPPGRVPVSPSPDDAPRPWPTPMAPQERNAVLARIVLGDLPPDHRASVVLCLQHGYSYSEAGEALGLPRDEVRAHLYEARQLFRRLVEATAPGGDSTPA